MEIHDEFSALPISPQYKYQLRMRKQGRCIKCGKPSSGHLYCEAHRRKRNNQLTTEKKKCYQLLTNAIASGKIVRGKCWCGLLGQAHHQDYSKPLEVVWLCHRHHNDMHGRKTFSDRQIQISNPIQYRRDYYLSHDGANRKRQDGRSLDRKEYHRKYREENRERLREYARKYRQA